MLPTAPCDVKNAPAVRLEGSIHVSPEGRVHGANLFAGLCAGASPQSVWPVMRPPVGNSDSDSTESTPSLAWTPPTFLPPLEEETLDAEVAGMTSAVEMITLQVQQPVSWPWRSDLRHAPRNRSRRRRTAPYPESGAGGMVGTP